MRWVLCIALTGGVLIAADGSAAAQPAAESVAQPV
jgi:hypothetical protein